MGFWNDLLQNVGESFQVGAEANAMAEELERTHNSAWGDVIVRHTAKAYRAHPDHGVAIAQTFSRRLGQLEDESPRMRGVQALFAIANIAALQQANREVD